MAFALASLLPRRLCMRRCSLLLLSLATRGTTYASRLLAPDLTFLSQFSTVPEMASLLQHANGWHPGERAVHALLKVPTSGRHNPTAAGLPPSYAYRVSVSPLLAVGTVDGDGRPWTSIWGGERGFARPVAQGILGVQSLVNREHDPVVQALLGSAADGEVLQPESGNTMGALSIDLETRDRVKLAGKMAVGTVAGLAGSVSVGEMQLAMHVQESLGNCPKYLNKKTIQAHRPSPHLVSSSLPLSAEAVALIGKADMIFVSSTNGQTMDTNHRGGPPGFVRVVSNNSPSSGEGVVLAYPEYSGNRLYQTLGNLHTNPRIGIAIPDFDTSSILYLTGETQLLVGASAAALMPHTSLAVKITVQAARFVRDGLPFRGTPGEPSPYNPPVRRLACEYPSSLISKPADDPSSGPLAMATLVRREPLTPSIARFTFRLRSQTTRGNNAATGPTTREIKTWRPGQHITLSFAGELGNGWAHMNDADPQSLNDDYVRTFTISNPPPAAARSLANEQGGKVGQDDGPPLVELTLRRHGPATGLLFAHRLPSAGAANAAAAAAAAPPLEIPVLAIGGEEGFRILGGGVRVGEKEDQTATTAVNDSQKREPDRKKAVFVAGGIGITPLLAQAPEVLAAARKEGEGEPPASTFEVLWSLRTEDLPLAADAFARVDGLAGVTRLFVTSGAAPGGGGGGSRDPETDASETATAEEKVRAMGARVEVRRLRLEDVLGARNAAKGTKYFVCAGPGLLRAVLDWVGEEAGEVAFESFEY